MKRRLISTLLLILVLLAPGLARAQVQELVSMVSFQFTPMQNVGLSSANVLLASQKGFRVSIEGIQLWIESQTFTGTPFLASFRLREVFLASAGTSRRISRDVTPNRWLSSFTPNASPDGSFSLALLEPGIATATNQARDRFTFYHLASMNADIELVTHSIPAVTWKAIVWTKTLSP